MSTESRQSHGPEFLTNLREFRNRLASAAEGRAVLKKLDSALRQLAKRSPIDRRRVYVGVKLEPKIKKAAASAPAA